MKRFTLLSAVSCCLALALTTPAKAAIEASSYLYISNFKVIDVATNLPITAGVGGKIAVGAPSETSTTSATLNGLTGQGFAFGIDSPAAYSNGLTNVAPGGIENQFSPRPLAIALPYSRSDTNGGGTAATILPGPPTTGAFAQSISDVVVPNSASIDNIGVSASTQASSTALFTFLQGTTVRFEFDAFLDITLAASVPPEGLLLTASSSFAASLLGTGIIVDGEAISGNFEYKPGVLNTGLLSLVSPGNGGASVSQKFVSPEITVNAGSYTFQLTQGTTAEIEAVVPEPASIAGWGILAICATGFGLKRTYFAS